MKRVFEYFFNNKSNSLTTEEELFTLNLTAVSGLLDLEITGIVNGSTDDKRIKLYSVSGVSETLIYDSGSNLNNLDGKSYFIKIQRGRSFAFILFALTDGSYSSFTVNSIGSLRMKVIGESTNIIYVSNIHLTSEDDVLISSNLVG